MRLRAAVTVAAIVQREQSFLLVEERSRRGLVLNQPAGHVEAGETLIEAVIRETREESAWDFKSLALVGVYLWRNPDNQRSTLRFAFCGTVDRHDPAQALDRGIIRALWMDLPQVDSATARLRSPLVRCGIDDFLAGHRYPLESVVCLDAEGARRRHITGSGMAVL